MQPQFWIVTLLFLMPCITLSRHINAWFPVDHGDSAPQSSIVFYPVEGEEVSAFPSTVKNIVQSVLARNSNNRNPSEWFQWSSLTVLRDSNAMDAGSVLVLGGSAPTEGSEPSHPFTKFASGVVSCRFRHQPSASYGFVFQDCEPLDLQYVQNQSRSNHSEVGLLGWTVVSVPLNGANKEGAVLVYCDPLWRADGLHAGGRCHIRLRQNGTWSKSTATDTIEFCTSSGHSQPCGGGFSVDLLQQSGVLDSVGTERTNGQHNLPNVKLLVGLPFAQPHGEVQMIENILNLNGDASLSIRHIMGSRENFGTKVAWTPEMSLKANRKRQLRIVDALEELARTTINQWTQESLALITSSAEDLVLAYRHLAKGQVEQLFSLQPAPTLERNEKITSFGSGFGQAMDTVIVPVDTSTRLERAEYAIILGAPFQSSQRIGPNHGRVYIICPGMSNVTEAISFLDGTDHHIFFGYSVVRLGDVDGDGIDDVAIGAPGLYGSDETAGADNVVSVPGKVYIHRVTSDCKLDPEPIQILTAADSQPGDGFGIALSRGIDMDADGWPELFVSSLRFNQVPYAYTMPRRLRAQCHITIPPGYSMNPFKAGTTIPVTIMVRLFDPHKNNWVSVPHGVSSTQLRIHQINPDIVWQERLTNRTDYSPDYETSPDADSFFATLVDGDLDLTKPRFALSDDTDAVQVSLNGDSSQMYVRAKLQARYSAQTMDLSAIPLRVGYRSFLNTNVCPTLHANNPLCIKMEQPLVDWSSCSGTIELDRHICVPDPECVADIGLEQLSFSENNRSTASDVRLEFGNPKVRQQQMQFRLTNRGPTKTTGVRIQLYVTGRQRLEQALAVQMVITEVTLDGHNKQYLNRKMWSVDIAEDGSAAMIATKAHHWIYPGESVQFNVSLFAEGLREQTDVPADVWDISIDNETVVQPGLIVRATSVITDPWANNDELTVSYNLVYKPRVEISAGIQPSTVIDQRKSATLSDLKTSAFKVFSHEIGPSVDHMFLIENRGQTTLHNLTLVLDLPMETTNGKRLLYLTDRTRRVDIGASSTESESMLPHLVGANGQKLGECHVPAQYINPYGLTILEYQPEGYRLKRSVEDHGSSRKEFGSRLRSERDVTIQRLEDPEGAIQTDLPVPSIRSTAQFGGAAFQRTERGRIYLRCPPHAQTHSDSTKSVGGLSNWDKCAEIHCNVARLNKGDTVRLRWTGWLWAATFFDLHTPDIQLISRLRVLDWGKPPATIRFYQMLADRRSEQTKQASLITLDYPEEVPSFELKQSIIFRNIHPDVIHQVPWWPIVCGIVVGTLLLGAMGACCYCCGFFRRKKIPGKDSAKRSRTRRSTSEDRLLSTNGSEADHNGTPAVPSFLSTKPLPAARMHIRSKPTPVRQWTSHGKSTDQTEFLVQASPNLLCAEEPEPPSPKVPPAYVGAPIWETEQQWTDQAIHEPMRTEQQTSMEQLSASEELNPHTTRSTAVVDRDAGTDKSLCATIGQDEIKNDVTDSMHRKSLDVASVPEQNVVSPVEPRKLESSATHEDESDSP